MHPCDVWLAIEAESEKSRTMWETTRAICYNVAKFGNSDPRSFPSSITSFWKFEWDENSTNDELIEAARRFTLLNNGRTA